MGTSARNRRALFECVAHGGCRGEANRHGAEKRVRSRWRKPGTDTAGPVINVRSDALTQCYSYVNKRRLSKTVVARGLT